MELKIYAVGQAFPKEGIAISEATQILNNFASTYTCCTELAARLTVKRTAPPPTLRLIQIQSHSLDSILSLDFPTTYVTLAPLLPLYTQEIIGSKSWELFYKIFKIISGAAKIFRKFSRSPVFNFENCSDIIINVNEADGSITAPKYMKKILHRVQPAVNDLAELVQSGRVNGINIHSDISQDTVRDFDNNLAIDDTNFENFTTKEAEEIDNSISEILCRPYSINKNTGNGKLDYYDGTRWVPSISFTIEMGNIVDYIDAMKRESATLEAKKKFIHNSLGEKRISHLYLTGVASN